MVLVAVLVGAAVLCCCVLLVFGCVCHIFKRNGFKSFEDDMESGRNVSMYASNQSTQDTSSVTFEPLPDILAKTVSSRALRPRITSSDTEKQATAAKLVTVYKPFPRHQLLYVKEIGLGWFGQVLQGSANGISSDSSQKKVVVKMLKDDATSSEKALFLEEIAPYRDVDHPNILPLLGQCTETTPFLAILEYPPLGDLKSFLLSKKSGPFIQFAIDVARGLACLHKHSYVHHDIATRNCLLMSDMRVKIGDYGIGEDLFREDYYDTGRDLLPIRWMSPESLEVKQGIWQAKQFTFQSNVWSLSILLWEILTQGRKPYNNLRDEDVLHKVIRDGSTKLPPPDSAIELGDRWYEIMEMCWQEADDRPTADDILAFLQQIEEEVTSQSFDLSQKAPAVYQSPQKNNSNSSVSKNKNHSTQHVADVLVHRVDEHDNQGFENDFSQAVAIKKNRHSGGFEDDFVAGSTLNDNDLPHNDSILAAGGNVSSDSLDISKDIFAADQNLNLLQQPVPITMSTPSKQASDASSRKSDDGSTADNLTSQNKSKYTTATSSMLNPESNRTNNQNSKRSDILSENSPFVSENQINDEGYRTAENGSSPDIVLSKTDSEQNTRSMSKFTDEYTDDKTSSPLNLSPKFTDLETERAKQIYMSKGAGLPPSSIHKSRSLGTIPEDGIPSDNTSQSGVVFEDAESEDVGMNFEWDDYEGEQLVGRIRYMSEESCDSNRSPRHVEVEEWPFDQDTGSESQSKAGSIASDSDGEVTRLSIGSNTSIDTRARIASILTNRLNSLIKQTNSSHTPTTTSKGPSMFYSFSEYDNDIDSPEHAASDKDYSLNHASGDTDDLGMPGLVEEEEEREATEVVLLNNLHNQEQDDQLISEDLQNIADKVLQKQVADELPEVMVSKPSDHMLQMTKTQDTVA